VVETMMSISFDRRLDRRGLPRSDASTVSRHSAAVDRRVGLDKLIRSRSQVTDQNSDRAHSRMSGDEG